MDKYDCNWMNQYRGYFDYSARSSFGFGLFVAIVVVIAAVACACHRMLKTFPYICFMKSASFPALRVASQWR